MSGDKANQSDFEGERIAKRIARAGICSRREAESLIQEGRVRVNGKRIASPALNVSQSDSVAVDNKNLPGTPGIRLWRFHKPPGCLTTARDDQGRRTIFDLLPGDLPHLMPVGRLDMNSEGLLLLTNDGDLARYMEHPGTAWRRNYRVRVHGCPEEADIQKLKSGMVVDNVRYGSIDAQLESHKGANAWLQLSLREGKKREIRTVMGALGYPVNRLIRISYGPFQLGDLERGEIKEMSARQLKDMLPGDFKGKVG